MRSPVRVEAAGLPRTALTVVRVRVVELQWRSLLGSRPVEGLVVTLVAMLLAVLLDRRQLSALTTTVPGNLGDPLYFAWQMSWVGHALATAPGDLWTTPAFSGAADNLAYTDTVLGYAPLGLLTGEGQAGALAQLNLAVLIATVLAGVGGYVLARALGSGRIAALTAGAGFEFALWRLDQVIHVNVLSTGGIALALALLARGNAWSLRHGWRPALMSWRWIAAGWAVACWQLTFGFATGIWFGYSLALVMLAWGVGWVVSGRRRSPGLPVAVLAAHGLGGLAFATTAVLLVRPYLRVLAAHPEGARGAAWLPLFSPPWQGLLTAPETSTVWGERQAHRRAGLSWPTEMAVSPGVVLAAVAVVGIFFSVWPLRRRLVLLAAVAVTTVLATGTAFPGGGRWTYLPLCGVLPGWMALRTPGRLVIWVTLGLCLLAAGAVARAREVLGTACRRVGLLRGSLAGAVAAVLATTPAAAIVAEGRHETPHVPVATAPVRLAELEQPVLLLPSSDVADYHLMLWGTEGWPVLANGGSGFETAEQVSLRAAAGSFPDAASVAALRARGVRTVVVFRSRAVGTQWAGAADAAVLGLALRRVDTGDAVVFALT